MSADPRAKAAADWLATVNRSRSPLHTYPLKTLPRPTGRATRVIVTEYDLPRKSIEPHDVILDRDGMVWYSDFGAMSLGKMDPKTGKVTEYPIPVAAGNAITTGPDGQCAGAQCGPGLPPIWWSRRKRCRWW